MAFSRQNIEKRRLIDLVRLNPILWDCRLPHYKRSDKKKALKWNELGRLFGVNGERVQRTFTSLREIFRRELNHEKLLGKRFKSKWEYYEAMAFLKEVIRERKSRERSKAAPDMTTQQQNNSSNNIDEYQYFAPNDPNNPNNVPTINTNKPTSASEQQAAATLQSLQQAIMVPAAQTLPALPTLPAQPGMPPTTTTAASTPNTLPANSFQPDVILSQTTNNPIAQSLDSNGKVEPSSAPQISTSQKHASQTQPDLLLSSTQSRASSSSSIYIKDEPDSLEDETLHSMSSLRVAENLHKSKRRNRHIKVTYTRHALHDRYGNSLKRQHRLPSVASLIIDEDHNNNEHNGASAELDYDDDLDDDLVDLDDVELDDCDRLSNASTLMAQSGRVNERKLSGLAKLHQPSPRELLYSKFGEFLAARLNTLNEQVSNDLINKILMLIAEK